MSWLLLVVAGCAGPDADPVEVAERFHALRSEGDDRALHALLTDADRAAMPLEAFPTALPAGLSLELVGWAGTTLESATLLGAGRDTAAVVLQVSNGAADTIRLRATREPRRLLGLQRDRVRWRVSMELGEWARIDSLADGLRAESDPADTAAVAHARAYLEVAERHPAMARPADLDAAREVVRRATVAGALEVDLRVTESFMGSRFVSGQIDNPTGERVATLRLMVRDARGAEQRVEVWDIPPGRSTEVSQITQLAAGPLTHRLERIQVY